MNDINELKARAYDIISAIELMQHELQQINLIIAEKQKKLTENGNGINTDRD